MTHLVQTPTGTVLVQPADLGSLAQLTLAARTGRPAVFTPVSVVGAGRVMRVNGVRSL